MPIADTIYQARFECPELFEKGRDNAITCPIYRDGYLVAPSAATVSVYNASDALVVSAATATITADVATYTVSSATLSSEALGEGWRVVWTLTVGGVARTYDNDAALVRRALFPAVSHDDLYRVARALDPRGTNPLEDRTDYQDELDAAWNTIERRLIEQGRRPWLIVSPSALRGVTLQLWLALVFEGLTHRLDPEHREMATVYWQRYEAEWARLRLLYDDDDDGRATDQQRVGSSSTLWTC